MIIDIFPSPFGIYDINDVDLEAVKEDLKLVPTTNHVFIKKGKSSWLTNELFMSRLLQRPGLSTLTEKIKECLDDYCKVIGYPELDFTNSWHNYLAPGGRTGLHRHDTHEKSAVTGAFYVYAESGTCPFIIHSPFSQLKTAKFSITETKYSYETKSIDSVSGRLVLFPSWLEHETDENKSNNERIVISFNSLPKPMVIEMLKKKS